MVTVDECPACGRSDFKNEYGIGIHLVRYCDKCTESQKEFGRELISGENHPMYGYKMSEETKRKIGEASSGRKMPEEAKQKISDSLSGHEVSEAT
ncbi:NUMOD3 domain-containing DNA-binding protein [Halobacteria archaeon AArc-dxtr1]|nr:NUMOD3 domain-containing DNA-binding protein [Halobacteria archaeon AArc-dxtr1]